MQITNADNDILIDYQERGDNVLRVSHFSGERISKREFTKDKAAQDMTDLLVNYDYQRVVSMEQIPFANNKF